MAQRLKAEKTKRSPKQEVYQGKGGDALWYWRLRALNGEPVADGCEGYDSKAGAIRGALRAAHLMAASRIVVLE